MSAVAVKVMALQASLDPVELARREFRLRIESGRLYISESALATLITAARAPVKLERVSPGKIHVRVGSGLLSASAAIQPWVTGEGLLRLDIGGFVGAFFPLVHDKLEGRPGIRVEANRILVDLSKAAAETGLHLPPLKAARAGDGIVELEF